MKKKKNLVLAAFVLIVFILGLVLFFPRQACLPKTGNSVQTQQADLNGDKIPETLTIYYDKASKNNVHELYFAIFKPKNNQCVKLLEQKLEPLSSGIMKIEKLYKTMTEYAKNMDNFTLADLTADGLPDILVTTKLEGSGEYLNTYVYGLKDGKIQELWRKDSIPKGVAGIEDDKFWLIIPNYGAGYTPCCPTEWAKVWWQWQKDGFVVAASITESNANNDGLEKIKSRPFPKPAPSSLPIMEISSIPPFLIYPGTVPKSGQGSIPLITEPGSQTYLAFAVKNTTPDQIKTWYKDEFTKAGWSVQKNPGFADDNNFIFQKTDSKDSWLWLQVFSSKEDWDYIPMRDKKDLEANETGFRLFWYTR